MTNQALAEIVAVEKEIQARLAEERRKAAAWLVAERERISTMIEEEQAEAQRQSREKMAAAAAETEAEIAKLLRSADDYAANLRNLPDQRLQELVTGHLQRLLPARKA